MIESNWITWWQDDLPCEFSKNKTRKNHEYLVKVLGENWLKKRIRRGATNNPIIQRWTNNGANAYLELNALAEDIYLIEHKPGFKTILNDLKSTNTCAPTWHVIRCAAMFERGEEGVVSRFHLQTAESSPDFSLNIGSKEYPVEGKLLVESECEIEFAKYSGKLLDSINKLVLEDRLFYPQISIVIKCFEYLPEIQNIVESLKVGLRNYTEQSIKGSFDKFNIFIDPENVIKKNFLDHKSVYIFCPRSIKEVIRTEGRIKSASSQLKKYDREMSGFVCIGIGEHQDPYHIRDRLIERFSKSQLKSISGVLMLRAGTYLQKPKRSTLDLISIISNVNATMRIPTENLKYCPLGFSGKLIDGARNTNEVSAYRRMVVEGKVANPEAGLYMPDIKCLTNEMLL